MACEKVLDQNYKNIQIVDKELAKMLVAVTLAEICIIKQFLDEYPKLTEKQLRRLQDTDVHVLVNNKAIQMQKKALLDAECRYVDYGIEEGIERSCRKITGNEQSLTVQEDGLMQKEVLLETECGCIDYGIEELLKHSTNEQLIPIKAKHSIENEIELEREIKYTNVSQQGGKAINNSYIEQGDEKGRNIVVLWDLPKSFVSRQVKRMVGRFGKVITAECLVEFSNERCERLIQEAWVLPYGAKLTRVTIGKEHEKSLEEQKRYRAIISKLYKNIAE
ncbi:30938_t:CDS:2, partial [Gigaspora margarita]